MHLSPHVFGIQVGQTLEILNSDATLHNIHALPMQQRRVQQGAGSSRGMQHTHVFTHGGSDGARSSATCTTG